MTVSCAALTALLAWEMRHPLRKRQREPKLVRDARNLAIAGLGAVSTALLEAPLALRLAGRVERRRWGLLQRSRMPRALYFIGAVLAMDYTLYLWHVLTHRVPLLWRFHAMHHLDLDMDASTAIRFHFGELACSVPWRLGQIALLGVDAPAYQLWQRLTIASILFHHSNARLPRSFERLLATVFVTPRIHGLHHSTEARQRNANWSSGLSWWDRLHGTYIGIDRQPGHPEAQLGVPGFDRPDQVRLQATLALPFRADFCPDPNASAISSSNVSSHAPPGDAGGP